MPLNAFLTPPGLYVTAAAMAIILLLGLLVPVLAMRSSPRTTLRNRVATIAGTGARKGGAMLKGGAQKGQSRLTQGRVKELASGGSEQKKKRRVALRQMLEQAGLNWTPRKYYVFSMFSAVIFTGGYAALDLPFWGLMFAPIAGGLGFPRYYLKSRAASRQKKFTQQLADAIDIIVRGIRSGLPVGECLAIIGRESPEPIAGEFRAIVEGQRVGLTLKEIMDKAVERMPTADMRFFGVVLVLQQKTGGNLAEALSNLSGILRSRKKMAEKVRAMSSEARMTAGIIGALPFILGGLIYLLNPEYMSVLFTTGTGKKLLMGSAVWMGMGIFVMKQMIAFKV
jgi:tight adherence protein B